jgi:acyl-CoA synthetase (AMP-forming)/AMP-acid ligase II
LITDGLSTLTPTHPQVARYSDNIAVVHETAPLHLIKPPAKPVIVSLNGQEITRNALDAFCAARLPKYMAPHQLEVQATLPKTSTDKIDKARLR